MSRTTSTYWNPRAPDQAPRWRWLQGLEGKAQEEPVLDLPSPSAPWEPEPTLEQAISDGAHRPDRPSAPANHARGLCRCSHPARPLNSFDPSGPAEAPCLLACIWPLVGGIAITGDRNLS